MLLLQLCQFLLSPSKIRLRRGCVLFRRHVVQNDYVAFLEMEAVEVVQSILGLLRWFSAHHRHFAEGTHVHHVVKHDESCPTRLLFVADADLANATVAAKEVVQVFAGDLVVQILDEQDAVRTWRKLGLRN